MAELFSCTLVSYFMFMTSLPCFYLKRSMVFLAFCFFSVPLYIHCNAQNVEVKLPHYYCKKKDCGVVCGLFCTILVHRRSLLWRKSRRWRLAFVHRCFYIKNVSRSDDTISNARRNFESADVMMNYLINDSANLLFGLYKQKSKPILIACILKVRASSWYFT